MSTSPTDAPATATPPEGSAPAPAPWTTTHAELATKNNWATPDDAVAAYVAATTPKTYKPDEYKFEAPQNAKDIGYDAQMAGAFAGKLAELGIAPDKGAGLYEWYMGTLGAAATSQSEAQAKIVGERLETSFNDLTKAWGGQESPAFKRNLALADRAMNQLGLTDELVSLGVLHKDDAGVHVANAKVYAALAKIGAAMFAEDSLYGGSADSGKNPFDPKAPDLTAQSRLIKDSPEKALVLIDSLPAADREKLTYLRNSVAARVKS